MPKILIADDSIAVRKVAERLLVEAGMGVVLAANGEEAMAYLKKDCPDVIVSDVIMPDKSGYEVCAFVRATAALAATPVLLISGIVNDEVTKQAETCKADGVLKKPFQGTTLKDKILELIAKRQKPKAAEDSKSAAVPAAAPSIGIKAMPANPQTGAQISPMPVQGLKLMPTLGASLPSNANVEVAGRVKDTEERFLAEQARAETLAKRTVELEAEVGRMKGMQALLEAERRRANELEAKAEASETQASRVPQLEAALKAEQEAARKAQEDATAAQILTDRVAQLEAALDTERAAAAELVQQLSEMEKAATSGAGTAERIDELDKMLAEERQKNSIREQRLEDAKIKVSELEGLLAAERERNALLLRRVTESEQVALNATKRFEEMACKLGEIAGLASQLGKGLG